MSHTAKHYITSLISNSLLALNYQCKLDFSTDDTNKLKKKYCLKQEITLQKTNLIENLQTKMPPYYA